MDTKNIQKYFDKKILKIKKLTGGVTNFVFYIVTIDSEFIFRFYGINSDKIIDRENEIKLLNYLDKKCDEKFFPKIIKIYDNCRIEEYLNSYPIKDPLLYQHKIMHCVKHLHSIKMPNFLVNFWDRFYDWKEKTNNLHNNKIMKVINILKEVNYWNELVIGHGDLTLGNILVNKCGFPRIKLIDFEYCCKLPRGFEIANFLTEYNGLNCKYPNKKIREEVINNYLVNKKATNNDIYIIDIYSLISHYYWGCWSLIQNNLSQIDFDYFEYSNKRFNLFLKYFEIIFI